MAPIHYTDLFPEVHIIAQTVIHQSYLLLTERIMFHLPHDDKTISIFTKAKSFQLNQIPETQYIPINIQETHR